MSVEWTLDREMPNAHFEFQIAVQARAEDFWSFMIEQKCHTNVESPHHHHFSPSIMDTLAVFSWAFHAKATC